jgi:AcrR family transcriptional regulator
LLIYHFGSKEGLLTEVLDAMQAHLRDSLAALAETPARGGSPLLERVWLWALHERNFPYLKLLYELQILAIQNPATYAQYLQRNALDWQKHIEAALPATPHRAALATLCGAVFDGLFLEVLQTGNRARATRALREFLRIASKAYGTTETH